MTEDIEEIKKELMAEAAGDPTWTFYYGREVLTAEEAMSRIDTDPEFRAYVLKRHARRKEKRGEHGKSAGSAG